MKYCPTCHVSYKEASLQFCLDDGTPLVFLVERPSETSTFVSGEQQTVVRPSAADKQSSNPLTMVVLILLMVFFLFGIVGLGIWLYAGSSRGAEDAKDLSNRPAGRDDSSSDRASSDPPQTPTPVSNTNAYTPVPTSSPAPYVNSEQIKKAVSDRIISWKSAAEAINLSANLENYADRVDYYNAKGTTRDFIRKSKQPAYSSYDSISINITDLSVTPSPDGESASAVFDKEWEFSGPAKYTAGKVRQQMRLEKVGGVWLITAEKDLHLYYKNK